MRNWIIMMLLLVSVTATINIQAQCVTFQHPCALSQAGSTCAFGTACAPTEEPVNSTDPYIYYAMYEPGSGSPNVVFTWHVIGGTETVTCSTAYQQSIEVVWTDVQNAQVSVDYTVNGNYSHSDTVSFDQATQFSLPKVWEIYNCRTDTIDASEWVFFNGSQTYPMTYQWTYLDPDPDLSVGTNGVMIRDESHKGFYKLTVTRESLCRSHKEMELRRVYPTIAMDTATLTTCIPQAHDPNIFYPEDSLHDFLDFTWKDTQGSFMSNNLIDTVDYVGDYTFEIQEKGCIGDPTYDSTHVFFISVGDSPIVDLNFQEEIICFPDITLTATHSTPDSLINLYQWGVDSTHFESNTNSKTFRPYDATITFPGTYPIIVRVETACGVKDTFLTEVTYQGLEVTDSMHIDSLYTNTSVLGIGVGTFTNSRLMDLTGHPEMKGRSGYENGQLGTWRTDASYAYVNDRTSSAASITDELNLSVDGTFQYGGFSWNFAPKALANGWRHTATITKYDAFGTELENRDILGIHSAALYDCKGERETAVGANARYFELAFTGFEEYEGVMGDQQIGNFNLLHDSVEVATNIEISSGHGNKAIFAWPYAHIDALKNVEFHVAGKPLGATQAGFALDSVLLGACHSPHPTKDSLMIAYFDSASAGGRLLQEQGLWMGEMLFYQQVPIGTVSGMSITEEKAHTGKKSLRVDSTTTAFKQETLNLKAGEEYVISAWVSVQKVSLDENLSLETQFNAGIELGLGGTTLNFSPTGTIVEGWQRLEGQFTVPDSLTEAMTLKFTVGAGGYQAAYFDDLRLFPSDGNMQSYVYDTQTYRLKATLDNNNYASLYFYDAEGNLRIVKKETERGIKTIQEVSSNQPETSN